MKLSIYERAAIAAIIERTAPTIQHAVEANVALCSDVQLVSMLYVSMLYDGLAFGNWPWVRLTTKET